jgi:predicted MFS family arabinose efflux permease
VLFLVYVFNFIDRTILAILLEPIKRDLGISDTAMGFLTGFAFAAFYTVAGIPIARWADRGVRRSIIAMGLAVWSLLTALSGLAQNFVQLALARVGVGVGEAAGSPPAHSILSDYFPVEKRATAISIYNTGIHVGIMIGAVAGGWINQFFSWRAAFFVVGLPGILLAVVVRFTIHEPPRGHSEVGTRDDSSDALGDVLRYLLRRRSFVYFALAAGVTEIAGYGFTTWVPTFLIRVHGMETGAIGTWLGLVSGLGGASGALLGGFMADRLGRRDVRWYLWLGVVTNAATLPCLLLFLHASSKVAALVAYFPALALWAMYLGPVIAISHRLVKLRMRAMASAILFFILNIIGMGIGPQLTGLMNDLLTPRFGVEAIRWSMTITTFGLVIATLLFWLGSRALVADLAKSDSPA